MIIISKKIFDIYCKEISKMFINDKFILSLSIDYWNYKNIVIRFYKIRDNETPLIVDDLEQYRDNWILIAYINTDIKY
jgi:hypothetical protein